MTNDQQVHFRLAVSARDFQSVSDMAHELALFHKEDLTPDPVKLLTDSNWFSASIVSVQNLDVGFCAWYKIYACQSASRIYELQSLYVLLPYRGLQIATRMVRELAKLALADQAVIGIGVRKENLMALAFYKKIGCTVLDRNDIWHCRWGAREMQKFIESTCHLA